MALKDIADPANAHVAIQALHDRILPWYRENRRDLPWRKTRDAYGLVVAEFMLQQTGVDRVTIRWSKFLSRFPDWKTLAAASAGDVIREWQGLGYNRRALNLHRLATRVIQDFCGQLPSDGATLLKLPGVGPYTVAAIQSFVFDRDEPSIDVNLVRVLARVVLGLEKGPIEHIDSIARQALPAGQSAHWNQALMDFAAIQCTLRNPRCMYCPLLDICAYATNGPLIPINQLINANLDSSATANRQYPIGTGLAQKRVAERPAAYVGSTRYFRGRIVDRLRELAPGESISSDDLKTGLMTLAGAETTDINRLLCDLAKEGMIVSDEFGCLHLPG